MLAPSTVTNDIANPAISEQQQHNDDFCQQSDTESYKLKSNGSLPYVRYEEQPFMQYASSNPISNWKERTPTTLFSSKPITHSEEYDKAVNFQRWKILAVFALWLLLGPLVFRYALGIQVNGSDSDRPAWGSELDAWEQFFLSILFLGYLGALLRLVPVVCGRPSDIRSTKNCVLDGVAALGMCSPFSSEDDGILLRSMLGRTCTVFQTIGGRHAFQGLYVDTILNERRVKGEANRRHLWLSWMKFLTSLVDICLLMKEEEAAEATAAAEAVKERGIDISGGAAADMVSDDSLSSIAAGSPPRRVLYVGGINSSASSCRTMRSATVVESRFSATDARIRAFSSGSTAGAAASSSAAAGATATAGVAARTPRGSFKTLGNHLQLHAGTNAEYFSILKQWSQDDHQALSRVMAQDGEHSETASVFSASRDSRDGVATSSAPSNKFNLRINTSQMAPEATTATATAGLALPRVRKTDRVPYSPRLYTIMSANMTAWKDDDEDNDNDEEELVVKNIASASENDAATDAATDAAIHGDHEAPATQSPFYEVTVNESERNGIVMQPMFEKENVDIKADHCESDDSALLLQGPAVRVAASKKEADAPYPQMQLAEPELLSSRTRFVTAPSASDRNFSGGGRTRRDTMTNANVSAANGPAYFPLQITSSIDQYGHRQRRTSSSASSAAAAGTTLAAAGEGAGAGNEGNNTGQKMESVDSYTRAHSIPDLVVDLADLVPMIDFLNGWLEEMEANEFTYDYHDPKSAVEKLFLDSPFMRFFKNQYMLAAYAALDTLYDAFTGSQPDEPDQRCPVHPDEASEVEWKVLRKGLPDWTVLWSLVARARVREMSRDKYDDPYGPDALSQSTRIKPGAVVIRRPPKDIASDYYPLVFFACRKKVYKVHFIADRQNAQGVREKVAYLTTFPANSTTAATPAASTTGTAATRASLIAAAAGTGAAGDVELGFIGDSNSSAEDAVNRPLSSGVAKHFEYVCIPLSELELLEKNRGKTGAMNFYNDYLRSKTTRWAASVGSNHPIQTFMGVVDARHALIETDVFWNDALPYFSIVESTGQPGKRFGSLTQHSICITVQYPQYFTNVSGKDDFLDNSNSAFYTLWQVLRDCGKCICSSGSNTIWDISNPAFHFQTTTRSEDLATSQEYIPHSAAVYLPVNVAFGIAKKTEDYLDALYRWSAGPEEMLWPSFFQWKYLKQYLTALVPLVMVTLASFMEGSVYYVAYLFMLLLLLLKGVYDKRRGLMPLRDLAVASVFVVNMFIASGNLQSITWSIVFPTRLAMFGVLPLGRDEQQSVFWGWVALLFSFPTGVYYDAVIKMSRYLAPASDKSNYDATLWRGAQLYTASFVFTFMACVAGTWSSVKALLWDYDLSMWSSFTVPAAAFTKITDRMAAATVCSCTWWKACYDYTALSFDWLVASFTKPTIMTRRYVTLLFLYQFVCVAVSTFHVNYSNLIVELVVCFLCGINIVLMNEIAVLLEPKLKWIAGYPMRLEYLFGYLGLLVFLAAITNQQLITLNMLKNGFRLDNFLGG